MRTVSRRQTGKPCRNPYCTQDHVVCVPADTYSSVAGRMSVVVGLDPHNTYLWAGPARGRGARYVVNDPAALRQIARAILRNTPTTPGRTPRQKASHR